MLLEDREKTLDPVHLPVIQDHMAWVEIEHQKKEDFGVIAKEKTCDFSGIYMLARACNKSVAEADALFQEILEIAYDKNDPKFIDCEELVLREKKGARPRAPYYEAKDPRKREVLQVTIDAWDAVGIIEPTV
ncbi:hypothetical protein SARC_03472 [Sphaeroforma arctica JP610]|uniref:Uncharacterized protein n=1 Tax=Sphaeroforma arctica JP610 TaxID=667725 RepID=A0A0L0G632_9EUKA|nr:hypothetical protein SARC_03472 [Sphaeroforma arctica JP610]KNC84311.1 hypothetical protein SARC_03472 [Sphaeroforma arctica JP610]|eukprot:XP_014158213.1 hypothetical protein SARC_03472 [Sphaeroforma arctica JP610]